MNGKIRNLSKVWFKFSKTTKDGKILQFRWEQLPEHRFDEFIDFKMKYYIEQEMSHVVAGIYKNPEAMKEYRQILTNPHNKPSYATNICCVDDESSKIIAFDFKKLYKRGEIYTNGIEAQVRTTEMKILYRTLQKWDKLYPIPDVLIKYGVDKIFEEGEFAIHPDFRGYHITDELALLTRIVSTAHTVPLVGAWMTSVTMMKAAERDNWETVYEISHENMKKIFGAEFQYTTPFVYKVARMQELE